MFFISCSLTWKVHQQKPQDGSRELVYAFQISPLFLLSCEDRHLLKRGKSRFPVEFNQKWIFENEKLTFFCGFFSSSKASWIPRPTSPVPPVTRIFASPGCGLASKMKYSTSYLQAPPSYHSSPSHQERYKQLSEHNNTGYLILI